VEATDSNMLFAYSGYIEKRGIRHHPLHAGHNLTIRSIKRQARRGLPGGDGICRPVQANHHTDQDTDFIRGSRGAEILIYRTHFLLRSALAE
jgi:hypothetical protein